VGKIDLRYDYGFNENPTVDAPPTFRPSGCNSRRLHTRHLAVVCKHYTAALQTSETSGVVVFVVKRFIHNFHCVIVCWLSLHHVEYAGWPVCHEILKHLSVAALSSRAGVVMTSLHSVEMVSPTGGSREN